MGYARDVTPSIHVFQVEHHSGVGGERLRFHKGAGHVVDLRGPLVYEPASLGRRDGTQEVDDPGYSQRPEDYEGALCIFHEADAREHTVVLKPCAA